MQKDRISDYEDQIDRLKNNYTTIATRILAYLRNAGTVSVADVDAKLDQLHTAGVEYFNFFTRSVDEYGSERLDLNSDMGIRKVEDAVSIAVTICKHWDTINDIAKLYSISSPTPSPNAYASIQRLIKRFKPSEVEEIKAKFMDSKLPITGFDGKAKHSGWKVGGQKLTVLQIIVGLAFLAYSGWIVFAHEELKPVQYFLFRLLASSGIVGSVN